MILENKRKNEKKNTFVEMQRLEIRLQVRNAETFSAHSAHESPTETEPGRNSASPPLVKSFLDSSVSRWLQNYAKHVVRIPNETNVEHPGKQQRLQHITLSLPSQKLRNVADSVFGTDRDPMSQR